MAGPAVFIAGIVQVGAQWVHIARNLVVAALAALVLARRLAAAVSTTATTTTGIHAAMALAVCRPRSGFAAWAPTALRPAAPSATTSVAAGG